MEGGGAGLSRGVVGRLMQNKHRLARRANQDGVFGFFRVFAQTRRCVFCNRGNATPRRTPPLARDRRCSLLRLALRGAALPQGEKHEAAKVCVPRGGLLARPASASLPPRVRPPPTPRNALLPPWRARGGRDWGRRGAGEAGRAREFRGGTPGGAARRARPAPLRVPPALHAQKPPCVCASPPVDAGKPARARAVLGFSSTLPPLQQAIPFLPPLFSPRFPRSFHTC